jgi:hypothetical protein
MVGWSGRITALPVVVLFGPLLISKMQSISDVL